MKNVFYSVFLTLIILGFIGCKKNWLDQKPDKNLTVPSTLTDFEAMLDFETMYHSPLTFGDVASDGHYPTDAFFNIMPDFKKNAFTWTRDRSNINVSFWVNPYSTVFYANVVLEGLQKIKPQFTSDVTQFNRIMGTALFQRARVFFEMAQIWAPPFDLNSSSTDLSIPLRLESDINLPSKRSTVKQTYEQVIADLNKALPLLPSMPEYKNRASKAAVFGELARVYLSMQDYSSARSYADSCLKIYNALINFNTLPQNVNFIGAYNTNKEVIFHETQAENSSIPSKDIIDTSLYNRYDNNDLRKSIYFKKSGSTYVFKGNYFNSAGQLFTGLATDEIYLIRAEGFAREGNKNAALSDLNTLLQTRWKTNLFVPITASTADDALAIILSEREKELIFRGLRWMDLRRLNREPRFKKTIIHKAIGQTWTLEPNSYKYTFPIPDDIIQYSGMRQNPGW
jgi:tetratricopeptide (TPR) repeat protein